MLSLFSNIVTSTPFLAKLRAKAIPSKLAPITATLFPLYVKELKLRNNLENSYNFFFFSSLLVLSASSAFPNPGVSITALSYLPLSFFASPTIIISFPLSFDAVS